MAAPFFTPSMNLNEYAKGLDQADPSRPFIEMFAASSDIAGVIPLLPLNGFTFEGYRQAAMAGTMAFRALNAPSTSGAGTLSSYQESTYMIDHDITVDRGMVDKGGEMARALREKLEIAELGQLWVTSLLKGDNSVTPTGPNGLQKRSALFGRNLDNALGVAGGAPLSMFQLDEAIKAVNNPTHIICPWDLKSRWNQAQRNSSLTNFIIQNGIGDTGRPVKSYDELPLLFGYQKSFNPPILPFTEVATGGGAAQTASIYIMSFGPDAFTGIQNAPMEVVDQGLVENRIQYKTHIHWDFGFADVHPFSFVRLSGITNAAFVA